MPIKDDTWFKTRTYLHFDPPTSKKTAFSIISSPSKVSSHSYYPLIRFTISTQKIRFNKAESKVERKPPKDREISYAAHLDSHIYSYYCQILDELYEQTLKESDLDDVVLAFRKKGKSNINFAHDAFNEISLRKNCCAIGLDITGFFNNLDHQILKNSWRDLLNLKALPADHYSIYKSLTKFSFVNRDDLYNALKIPSTNPKNGRTRVCTPEEFRVLVRGNGLITINHESPQLS
ncbi:hypothetical protein HNE05_02305 [Aquipseudomonas campi]|uniref:Reverse transcriptase domain-containing protein n=1 Tax=Aquipseudomonas campi TaxID=2731681 RepID=A0A6M8FBI7_9GAMM|nr:hypothetical protein [Pseudomonas campi]QKE62247.1 hypothetical protein HNE05_02305 [Pseudomonas campi]